MPSPRSDPLSEPIPAVELGLEEAVSAEPQDWAAALVFALERARGGAGEARPLVFVSTADWRRERGDRLSVHAFTNFRARFAGDDAAEATNFLFLYARDGVKPQPSHEPVTISLATDRYVRRNGRWLCTYRRFEHLFESDVPVTNPNLDEDK